MAGSSVTYDLQSEEKNKQAQKEALRSKENKKDVNDRQSQVTVMDSTTESVEAEQRSVGFFGWFKRLFSDKIDFTINDTQIKGKDGFQARGGVVPLFSGGVLDLIPADLTGHRDQKDGKQTVIGSGAKLVIAPANKDYMLEVKLDAVTLSKTTDNKELILGASSAPVEFEMGNNKKVVSKGVSIYENDKVLLLNPVVKKEGETEEKEAKYAAVEKTGLMVVEPIPPAPQTAMAEERLEVEAVQDVVEDGADDSGTLESDQIIELIEDVTVYLQWVREFLKKLGISDEKIEKFLGAGVSDEEKAEAEEEAAEEEKKSLEVALLTIPIVPAITFKAVLEPKFDVEFDYHFGFKLSVPTKKNPSAPYKFEVYALAGLCGELGLALKLMIEAGDSIVFGASAALEAFAEIIGSAELPTGVNTDHFNNPLLLGQGSLIAEGKDAMKAPSAMLEVAVGAGIELSAGLRGNVELQSKVFDWDKTLWEYDFVKWILADLKISQSWKKDLNAGGLLSTKGWETPGLEATAKSLGEEVSSRDRYGLSGFAQTESRVNKLLEQQTLEIDYIQEIAAQIETINAVIQNKKGTNVGKADGDGIYEKLLDQTLALEVVYRESMTKLKFLQSLGESEMADIIADKKWNDLILLCDEKVKSHQDRQSKVTERKESHDESDTAEAVDADVAKWYLKTYGGSGMENALLKQYMTEAEKEVGTKGNIMKYERSHRSKATRKHTERINLIDQYQKARLQSGESDSQEKIEAYLKQTNSKNIFKYLGDYSTIEELLAFEQKGKEEQENSHQERIDKMEQKAAEMKLSKEMLDTSQPQFIEYYMDELKGTRIQSHLYELGQIKPFNVAVCLQEGFSSDIKGHYERIKELSDTKLDESIRIKNYNKSRGYFANGGVDNYKFANQDLYSLLESISKGTEENPSVYKKMENKDIASYLTVTAVQTYLTDSATEMEIKREFADSSDVLKFCEVAKVSNAMSKDENLRKMFFECYRKKHADQLQSLKTFDQPVGSKSIFEVWGEYVAQGGNSDNRELLNKGKDKKAYNIKELLDYEHLRIRELDTDHAYEFFNELLKSETLSVEQESRLTTKFPDVSKAIGKEHIKKMTPNVLFQYEKMRKDEKGKNHSDNIAYLNECRSSNRDYGEVIAGYREKTINQRSRFERVLSFITGTSEMSDYDKDMRERYDKDPEVKKRLSLENIRKYEVNKKKEKSSPFDDRIKFLQESQETNFSSNSDFGEMGSGFFKSNKKLIRNKRDQLVGAAWSYSKIMEYEKQRETFYAEKKKQITGVVNNLVMKNAEIDTKIQECVQVEAILIELKNKRREVLAQSGMTSLSAAFKKIANIKSEDNVKQIEKYRAEQEAKKVQIAKEMSDVEKTGIK